MITEIFARHDKNMSLRDRVGKRIFEFLVDRGHFRLALVALLLFFIFFHPLDALHDLAFHLFQKLNPYHGGSD